MMRTACKVVAVLIFVGGLVAAALSIYAASSSKYLGVSLLSVLPSTLMLVLVSAAVAGVLWMLASIDGRLEALNRDKA